MPETAEMIRGGRLVVYNEPQRCALCREMRRLYVDINGATFCYICYEKAGFDFDAALAAAQAPRCP